MGGSEALRCFRHGLSVTAAVILPELGVTLSTSTLSLILKSRAQLRSRSQLMGVWDLDSAVLSETG